MKTQHIVTLLRQQSFKTNIFKKLTRGTKNRERERERERVRERQKEGDRVRQREWLSKRETEGDRRNDSLEEE